MHIIIYGDPVDGLRFIGPFETAEEAVSSAENWRNVRNDTWWVAKMESPE